MSMSDWAKREIEIACKREAPDGTVERIDRFYAEDGNGWREIGFQEWSEREEADRHRREQEER